MEMYERKNFGCRPANRWKVGRESPLRKLQQKVGVWAMERYGRETFWKLPQQGAKPTEQQALAGKAGSMRTAGEEVQVD
jgi:hypothetical protein